MIWRRAGNPDVRHAVDVLRTVDGDTFDARVALWPGLELNTRVRLRGIDAPELSRLVRRGVSEGGRVDQGAARHARRRRRRDLQHRSGQVGGRVVADVATAKTPNVSSALVAAGHARVYLSGRRASWC